MTAAASDAGLGTSRSVRRGGAGEAGQASVELLALVPVLLAITLAVASLLAGQAAREAADQAAVAAAIAQLQGKDPKEAAKLASPGWSRARVRVAGGRVTVRVRPRVPAFVAALVDAERTVAFEARVSEQRPGASVNRGGVA